MSGFDYRVLAYVAGLELTVDRLRGQVQFLGSEAERFTKCVAAHAQSVPVDAETALRRIGNEATDFAEVLHDLQISPPDGATDVAACIPVRPLLEKVFRRLQRLRRAPNVELFIELDQADIVWFPSRLEHILEALIDNAFKGHDPSKGAARIQIRLRYTSEAYELHVTDNGQGLTRAAQARLFELFDRAGPARLADPVVGLAVLKLVIEQSGGSLRIDSEAGVGTSFIAVLPRFSGGDFLS